MFAVILKSLIQFIHLANEIYSKVKHCVSAFMVSFPSIHPRELSENYYAMLPYDIIQKTMCKWAGGE